MLLISDTRVRSNTHCYVVVDSHRPTVKLDETVNRSQLDSQLLLLLAVPLGIFNHVKVVDRQGWGRGKRLVLPLGRLEGGLILEAQLLVELVVQSLHWLLLGLFGGANCYALFAVHHFQVPLSFISCKRSRGLGSGGRVLVSKRSFDSLRSRSAHWGVELVVGPSKFNNIPL